MTIAGIGLLGLSLHLHSFELYRFFLSITITTTLSLLCLHGLLEALGKRLELVCQFLECLAVPLGPWSRFFVLANLLNELLDVCTGIHHARQLVRSGHTTLLHGLLHRKAKLG